jgi:hypothetical protein
MSIATLKKKSAVVNSKNHSNRDASLYWVGGVGSGTYGTAGFSINGPRRNVGYVGQNMGFSKAFTPFKGALPVGHGGSGGKYSQSNIVLNVSDSSVETKGNQSLYNKSSVISTYGMLRSKYRWAYSGTFPNYWVQPDANNSDHTSQGAYVLNKSSANAGCVVDTNDSLKYVDNTNNGACKIERLGNKSVSRRLNCENNYTKSLRQPVDSSIYTLRVQQKCANPTDEQKPFPYAVNNNGCNTYVYKPKYA